ncbi:MAG: hypothetical protein ACKVHQ_11025 [Gammaproteobacteria bacterium]|jgi:hypothetical protein
MQTIVELPEFLRKSDKLLSKAERLSIINYLAAHPAAGDIMQGTGGIRKLRWLHKVKEKVAEYVLSITITMNQCLYFY